MFLGLRALLAARRGEHQGDGVRAPKRPGPAAAFRHGLLTNVLNPKAAVFFIALRRVLSRARVRRAIDAVMGTILVAIGVRIATQGS